MERYTVEKKIGKGSYGSVYVVRCKQNNQRYVMKKIPTSGMSTKERRAAKQEVALLQSLQHPNIVAYKDSFVDKTDLCIIMTHCSGGDLATKIERARGKKFSEEQIVIWFSQLALAIEFIHSRRILHRDLKSQNVFIAEDGRLMLGDFGIARVLDCTVDMAQTSIGTPLYMSPETVGNRPYNFKSDIWALGCLLYEMAALHHPFNARDLRGLFVKIVRGVYSPIPFSYSTNLRQLVGKLLKTNPKQRPNAHDVLHYGYTQKHCAFYVTRSFGSDFFSSNAELFSASRTQKLEAVEMSNLKIQLDEMNIKVLPSDELEKQTRKREEQKRVAPQFVEAKKAVSQLNRMEQERKRVQDALEKLRLKRKERVGDFERRNAKRLGEIQQKRQDEKKRAELEQKEKMKRAEEKRLRMQRKRVQEVKKRRHQGGVGNIATPSSKQSNRAAVGYSKKVDGKTPQQRLTPVDEESTSNADSGQPDRKNFNELKVGWKSWAAKVEGLEREIQQLELLQREKEHQKDHKPDLMPASPQKPSLVSQPTAQVSPPMSHKDRILEMKERKRKQEEQRLMERLRVARREYHVRKVEGKKNQYDWYHSNSVAPTPRGTYSPAPIPVQAAIDNNDAEFKVQTPRIQNSVTNVVVSDDHGDGDDTDDEEYRYDEDEDDEDDVVIREYERNLRRTTKQIEQIRKSIHTQFGGQIQSVDDLKRLNGGNHFVDDEDDDGDTDLESGEDDGFNSSNNDYDDVGTSEEEDEDQVRIGRLADRVSYLRQQCIKLFGSQDTFEKAYRCVKQFSDSRGDSSKNRILLKILNGNVQKLAFSHLVEELIFVESSMDD